MSKIEIRKWKRGNSKPTLKKRQWGAPGLEKGSEKSKTEISKTYPSLRGLRLSQAGSGWQVRVRRRAFNNAEDTEREEHRGPRGKRKREDVNERQGGKIQESKRAPVAQTFEA
jgi:hypothetical protein